MTRTNLATLLVLMGFVGCSAGTEGGGVNGTGGTRAGTGGTVATGGRAGTGGAVGTGGSPGGHAGSGPATGGQSQGGRTGSTGGGPSGGAPGGASTGGQGTAGRATGGVATGGRGPGGNAQAGAAGGSAQGGAKGGASAGGNAQAGAAGRDLLVPATGALLGLYYGAGTLAATDARIGRTPQIHLAYYGWDDAWEDEARVDLDAGRIPLISWEPGGIDFHDIVAGTLDANIKARANGAKALRKPFFLDFAAESNGDEAWSKNDAALYVAAYRRIHDLFLAAGATNVVWAWCPNVTDTDGTNKMTMAYYPGDAYVDWTGVDGYNWGGSEWQSFEEIFANIYPLLAAKNKPIIIGEMASAEAGGNKATWIDAIIPTLKTRYPMFKALVWFDVNKENDWRINSSSAALAAFARMATDPYFNP